MPAFRNLFRRLSVSSSDKKSKSKKSEKVDPELLVTSIKSLIPPNNKKWVLFKNGTVVVSKHQPDNVDNLINEAKVYLRRSSLALPAAQSLDSNVTFASEVNGWLVSYDTERIYTFLPAKEVDSDEIEEPELGSVGKTRRQRDAEELNVIYVTE